MRVICAYKRLASDRKFTAAVVKNERPAVIALIVINVSSRQRTLIKFFFFIHVCLRRFISHAYFDDSDACRANACFLYMRLHNILIISPFVDISSAKGDKEIINVLHKSCHHKLFSRYAFSLSHAIKFHKTTYRKTHFVVMIKLRSHERQNVTVDDLKRV